MIKKLSNISSTISSAVSKKNKNVKLNVVFRSSNRKRNAFQFKY